MIPGLNKQTFDGINEKWFERTCQKLRNKLFQFYNHQVKFRLLIIPPSPKDKIIQESLKTSTRCDFRERFWRLIPRFSHWKKLIIQHSKKSDCNLVT